LAHQDGCVVAGSASIAIARQSLIDVTPTAVFAAATVALSLGDRQALEHVVALSDSQPASSAGLSAAMAWVSPSDLRGIGVEMLRGPSAFRRRVAVDACRLHAIRPGGALETLLGDRDAGVRATAVRLVGALGERTLASVCAKAMSDEIEDCRFWAAWSGVLLGDLGASLGALSAASRNSKYGSRAFDLALQAMRIGAGHAALQELRQAPNGGRSLMKGSGIVGDPEYVPWLIENMSIDGSARLAGEAFSLITGADLALLDLDRRPPENFEAGPNDDPDDPNVDIDPDEGLPWPDVAKIEQWWAANSGRFRKGARYFMGAPVTREHCVEVLKNGYQPQRVLAAHYLCLLEPGTPLFNTRAPAWRQQRLLARMA
jgi:uncharacterized protein (TIGR02270 family)